jgi:NAD(P)H-flavin reductase
MASPVVEPAARPLPERAASPWLPRFFRVHANREEAGGVHTLEIERPADGFAFEPGQFNMLYAFGVGEVAISISGHGDEPYLTHTIRAVGPVSKALTRFEPGMQIGVRGPYGRPWPLTECEGHDVLLVAGGIGLAPLRGALLHLLRHRERFGRVACLIGGRSPDQLVYWDEIRALERAGTIQIEVTVDHAPLDWHGHVGVVTDLLPRLRVAPQRTMALLCGPEVMIRFAAMSIEDLGVPAERIFISAERNMKCAIGHCGRCQLGPNYVCKDGPVFSWQRIGRLVQRNEI